MHAIPVYAHAARKFSSDSSLKFLKLAIFCNTALKPIWISLCLGQDFRKPQTSSHLHLHAVPGQKKTMLKQ